VTVQHGAAVWYCHRCGSTGRLGHVARGPQRSTQPVKPAQQWSPKAAAIWAYGRSLTGSDVVSRYLSRRACALPLGDDVRWLPADAHHRCPSMLARITHAVSGDPLSLHFTKLKRDASGKAGNKPRLLLAGHQKRDGVVRLTKGPDDSRRLGVAEGIESALSITGVPMWACIDAHNMAALPLLPDVRELHIFADNDASGVGSDAAETLCRRWLRAGRSAVIHMPKIVGTDFNDVAMAESLCQ
jgi:putative DNA primase/helicase